MILLTGATGNVGRPLAGLLVEGGVPFKAFVRDVERARDMLGSGVELVRGDFAEPATLEAALEGVEVMFLLNGDPELEVRAIDVVARRSGVRRVVKQSALAVGLDPPPFHRRIEEKLERSGLGYTHLRPNAFMQTLAGYLPALIDAGGMLRLPAGDGRVGWVDTRDIAAVAFHALTEEGHEGSAYPITGPESLSMAELAEKVSGIIGRQIRYEDTPPGLAARHMVERGLAAPFADFLVGFYAAVREGSHDVVTDTVVELSGRSPSTFDAFVREHVAAFGGGLA
jgi:uncharacterized protein YbjT (DUF2867 family)